MNDIAVHGVALMWGAGGEGLQQIAHKQWGTKPAYVVDCQGVSSTLPRQKQTDIESL